MKMLYRSAAALLAFLPLLLAAQDIENIDPDQVRNSYIEFPTIVLVGQVTDITLRSVTFSNPIYETPLTVERLDRARTKLESSRNETDKGFLRALRLVSVKNDHMQMTFYPDMMTKIFHDDLNTYQQYLPLFFLMKNNLKEMALPQSMLDRLKAVAIDTYLTIPFVKKIMKDAWGAAVFQIHPETNKLLYVASRFYENYDEMIADEFAKEYMIPEIVRRGMTVSATVAVVRGDEKEWLKEDVHKKYKDPANKTPGNRVPPVDGGTKSSGGGR